MADILWRGTFTANVASTAMAVPDQDLDVDMTGPMLVEKGIPKLCVLACFLLALSCPISL